MIIAFCARQNLVILKLFQSISFLKEISKPFASGLIENFTIEMEESSRPVWNTFLFLLHGNNKRHLEFFLSEISFVN